MTARAWVVAVVGSLLVAATAAAQCLSTTVPVSQPVVFPNHAAGPLAWTGSVFGVSKLDAGDLANPIDFAIYNADLNQIGSDVVIAPSSFNGPRAIVWNGSEFAVFYQTTNLQLVFQRVDASGKPIGSPIAVAPQHGVAPGVVYDATWDPARQAYAILHTVTAGFQHGLWLTLMTPDGVQKSDSVISVFTGDPVYPAFAVTQSGIYGIAWSRVVNDQQEIAFETVTADGTPTNVVSIRANGSSPKVATDGRTFLVVYSAPVTGGTILRAQKFDLAANAVTADTPLANMPSGGDVVSTSLIANPDLGEYALLYQLFPIGIEQPSFAETRLHRIPFSGGVQTDAPLALDTTKRTIPPTSALTWNGSAYVASESRLVSRAEGTESYLVRQCPLLVTATVDMPLTLPGGRIVFTAHPSGGTPPYTYLWSFGDVSANESGQTVTHAYHDPGTYTATVTITDVTGASRTSTVTVTVANLKRRPSKHL